jgi:hypothetical protein
MTTARHDHPSLAAPAAALLASAAAHTAAAVDPQTLVAGLKSKDDAKRGQAIDAAPRHGAGVVQPLCQMLGDPELENTRAAKRALNRIVHEAGRPDATQEAKAVERELVEALRKSDVPAVCRETLWLLSEIAGDGAVGPVAALLANPELREDARMVLQRIPGKASLKALRAALESAPADFRNAIAESLVRRGEKVAGFQSQKLKPTKPTSVKAD